MSKAIPQKQFKRQAFARGFVRGLAAPGLLFAPASAVVALDLDVSAAPIVQTPKDLRERSDWDRIGVAVKAAMIPNGR